MTPLPQQTPALTLVNLATARANSFCKALDMEDRAAELVGLCERFMSPWGLRPLTRDPQWTSHVVDDGTPFEFSVAFGATPELRFMAEPLGTVPSLSSNTSAARVLLASLARYYDIDLRRFEQVADLFLPASPAGAFAIWVAVTLARGEDTQFKLYLNPQARGAGAAPRIIEQALVRLGFSEAWPVVGNVLTDRGPKLDELKYFSLDLAPTKEARVKVYARHLASSPEVVAAKTLAVPMAHPGEVQRFLRTAAPRANSYDGRGPITCYAFVQGTGAQPDSVTTHFPINGYAENYQVVQERVRACHDMLGLSAVDYIRVVSELVDRPVDDGVGLQSYVSFRRHAGRTRLTVYFPTEAYAPGTVEDPRVLRKQSGVMESVNPLVRREQERHPFWSRLRRDELDPARLWLIAENLRVGLAGSAQRLQTAISELDDHELAMVALTAAQEDDDAGAMRTAHESWLQHACSVLSPWRPTSVDGVQLAPSRTLIDALERAPCSTTAHGSFGNVLAIVLAGAEACSALASELGRDVKLKSQIQRDLPSLPEMFESPWSLAGAVPVEHQGEFLGGVGAGTLTIWKLLNELYSVCFSRS